MKNKLVVGLTEKVTMIGPKGKRKRLTARIDTGATKSSVDAKLTAELSLGPIIKTKLIKSASGNKIRPVLKASVKIKNKELKEEFTVADRSHLRYRVLIGQNILKKGFLIDPNKK